MSRTRKYEPMSIEQATARQILVPSQAELRSALTHFVGSCTGTAYGAPENATISRVQIFHELIKSLPELTPLPRISQHAAMYAPRLSEIREDLQPLGLTIQCYQDRVAVPGSKFKQTHSYYRVEYNAVEQNQRRSLSQSRATNDSLFRADSSASLNLEYERGVRR